MTCTPLTGNDGLSTFNSPAAGKMGEWWNGLVAKVRAIHNEFHSAGVISGLDLSDAGGENIAIADGAVYLRPTDDPLDELLPFALTSISDLAIPTDTTRYIGVEYNGGAPQVVVRSVSNWNGNDDFELGTINNEGGTLHVTDSSHQVGDHAGVMIDRMRETMPFIRDNKGGGLLISETGTRNIAMTAGAVWEGLSRLAIAAFDTSGADTFQAYYRDGGGGWTSVAAQSAWNNTQYDDGSGVLATLGNNRWAAHWMYVGVDGDPYLVYSQDEYNTEALAEDAGLPLTPPRFTDHAVLIGRIVFKKSDATGVFQSSFGNVFNPTAGAFDAANITYSAGVVGNWDGGVDPGETSGALDQLAKNLKPVSQIGTMVYSFEDPGSDWFPCDGRILSQATYADLYSAVGLLGSGGGLRFDARAAAGSTSWQSVCWSQKLGLLCAVSNAGSVVMTSPDGVTWTTRTHGVTNAWRSICWGDGPDLYVAVSSNGTGNRVMTSPDGITWTARTSAADNDWRSVCWAGGIGLYVAVSDTGTGNRVMTSPDGITWTIRTSAADNSWAGVCWADEIGLVVAVAKTGVGNRVMTSPDGINWTARTSAVDNDWDDVCWADKVGLLVAIANTGTGDRVMTSPDGITWTARTSAADYTWRGVCWAKEIEILVACAGTGTGDRVMISRDGINWSLGVSPEDNNWASITWANGINSIVSVSTNGTNRVFTSAIDYNTGTEFRLPSPGAQDGALPYIRHT